MISLSSMCSALVNASIVLRFDDECYYEIQLNFFTIRNFKGCVDICVLLSKVQGYLRSEFDELIAQIHEMKILLRCILAIS